MTAAPGWFATGAIMASAYTFAQALSAPALDGYSDTPVTSDAP